MIIRREKENAIKKDEKERRKKKANPGEKISPKKDQKERKKERKEG